MKETTPTVRLIAEPSIRWNEVYDYLSTIGGVPWYDRVTYHPPEAIKVHEAELLAEYAGRRCYKSWVPKLNPNVTQVREDSASYINNVLAQKHGAVLEHAQFTFDFDQVSRVFTHELVRHRAGIAISQESLRYVRLDSLGFRIPPILADGPSVQMHDPSDGTTRNYSMRDAVISIVERLEEFQRDAAEAFGLDDEGVPFHYKKEVTSALRRLAPIGLSTGMVWSANLRTLRHVIPLRTAAGAEEEIRLVFHDVGQRMKKECPLIFTDFNEVEVEGSDIPAWVPEYEKV